MLFMQNLIRFDKELFCIENYHLFAVMLVQNEKNYAIKCRFKEKTALVNL